MGRLKGETGLSPVLSRNCKEDFPSKPGRPPQGVFHNLAEKEVGSQCCAGLAHSLSLAAGSFISSSQAG
jgi:hypothetical protein